MVVVAVMMVVKVVSDDQVWKIQIYIFAAGFVANSCPMKRRWIDLMEGHKRLQGRYHIGGGIWMNMMIIIFYRS